MGWKPLPEDICHFNNRKIHLWPNMSLNLISREHNTNSVLPSRTLPSRTHPSEVYLNSVLPSRTLPSRTHPCTSSLPSWSALILSRAALAVSASPNLTQAYGFSIKVFVSFTLKSNRISIDFAQYKVYLYGNDLQILLDVKVNNNNSFDMRDIEKLYTIDASCRFKSIAKKSIME